MVQVLESSYMQNDPSLAYALLCKHMVFCECKHGWCMLLYMDRNREPWYIQEDLSLVYALLEM